MNYHLIDDYNINFANIQKGFSSFILTQKRGGKKTDRQTDRQVSRQRDRETERQRDELSPD